MRVLAAFDLTVAALAPAAPGAAGCGPLCRQRANALPRTTFYDPPDPLPLLAENSTGFGPVGGPVLLLQGDADQAILVAITGRWPSGSAAPAPSWTTAPSPGSATTPSRASSPASTTAPPPDPRSGRRPVRRRPDRSTC